MKTDCIEYNECRLSVSACTDKHKKGNFSIELSGYLANLQVPCYVNKSKVCFVSGDYDCLTVGEVIKAAGYDPTSLINRRLLITIEDET